jgi:hypothetical protein
MKKAIVIVLLLTTLSPQFSNAQLYYDAKSLRESLDADGHFGLNHLPLFRKYCPGMNDNTIVQRIFENPFLTHYFDDASSASLGAFAGSTSVAGTVAGINVTNFADGLARFLVARFREELSITFFEKFKQALQQSEYEDLRRLFPETYKLLLTIGEDIYRFNAFLSAMRETFIKDLSNLYTNFQSILQLDKYQQFFEQHIELRTIMPFISSTNMPTAYIPAQCWPPMSLIWCCTSATRCCNPISGIVWPPCSCSPIPFNPYRRTIGGCPPTVCAGCCRTSPAETCTSA